MPARWRSSPAFQRTPTGTWAGCWTPSKRWVIWTTPSSSTSGATTGPAWRAPSPAPSTRRPLRRGRARRRQAAGDHRQVRWRRGAGRVPHRPPLRRGVGPCQQHPVSVGQADGQPPGRGPGPDGGRLAEPHPGRWGAALPVHPLHRHRPHGAGAGRHPRANGGRRHRPGADGRHQLRLHPRRCWGRRAPHGAVLRDARQPGHLQGWLVGLRQARQDPLGLHPRDDAAVRSRCLRPGAGPLGAVLPARRLPTGQEPGRRPARQAGRAQEAVLAGGRAQPRAAAAGRLLGVAG